MRWVWLLALVILTAADGRQIWLNKEQVIAVTGITIAAPPNSHAQIWTVNNSFWVRETPEEVAEKLDGIR